MRLEELIKEVLKQGIHITGVDLAPDGNGLAYEIAGFSKSGTAKIYFDKVEDDVICETRYTTIDIIRSFEDLASVAFRWNANYCDREPFGWDENWLPIFEKFGWVKVHEKVVKDVEITCL